MSLYEFDAKLCREGVQLIGTDEAGRGPLAGPVVAAAVILDHEKPIFGIDDSKKLSAKKRDELYSLITDNALAWSYSVASPEEIDRINILQASLKSMYNSIEKIRSNEKFLVLVDGNRKIPMYNDECQILLVKGDSKSASVAAASIIAKVTRDRIMESISEKYPEYGFSRHKGYPTKEHIRIIKEKGILSVHRKSFCHKFVAQTELKF